MNPCYALLMTRMLSLALTLPLVLLSSLGAQTFDAPDSGEPGDKAIQEYLRSEAEKLEADFLGTIKTREDWNQALPRFRREYLEMLGLWPLPEKTPLHETITRQLDRGDYVVDMLHYQSRPGLYVTGNLYRPR